MWPSLQTISSDQAIMVLSKQPIIGENNYKIIFCIYFYSTTRPPDFSCMRFKGRLVLTVLMWTAAVINSSKASEIKGLIVIFPRTFCDQCYLYSVWREKLFTRCGLVWGLSWVTTSIEAAAVIFQMSRFGPLSASCHVTFISSVLAGALASIFIPQYITLKLFGWIVYTLRKRKHQFCSCCSLFFWLLR